MRLIVSEMASVETTLQAISPVWGDDYDRLFNILFLLEVQRRQLMRVIADQTHGLQVDRIRQDLFEKR